MMDGDFDRTIGHHSGVVDGKPRSNMDHAEDDRGRLRDRLRLDPSRWWFAASAFPMLAGTLGPVASAFSICALVRPWRQRIPPETEVIHAQFVDDPIWLIAINAVQLAIAIIANMALLLNMAKRLRFSVAQPITITGWYIWALCLTALSATGTASWVEADDIWSSAFYYGIFAAVLYFIVASLMVITVWGAQTGHYPKDFELSTSQRTLMLQTIMFLMYLLFGALVFSRLEGWGYLDAVYWADVTLFTVGYGEISPQTTLGRALMIPYALVGVISLGLVIGSMRSLMLDRGKDRLEARMLERRRRQLLRNISRRGNNGVLVPIDNDKQASTEHAGHVPQTELDRRQKEFNLMRKIQDQTSAQSRWTSMAVSGSTWMLLWLLGAKIFQECEAPYQGWNYFDAFYFAFISLITIGYGDLTPVSPPGKAFFVFWSLLALPTMTILVSNAADTIVKWVEKGTLRLGNITILPGEGGFKLEVRQILSRLSCRAISNEIDDEVLPMGILGASSKTREEEEAASEADYFEERTAAGTVREKVTTASTTTTTTPSKIDEEPQGGDENHSSSPRLRFEACSRQRPLPRKEAPFKPPRSRARYHLLLIDEIRHVTQHLQQQPTTPRKYTFREWAWYLGLIGEDESSAVTHRKPTKGRSRHKALHREPRCGGGDGDGGGNGGDDDDVDDDEDDNGRKHGWSWVGHKSPLMDTREETEWILDKLQHKLGEELRTIVVESEGNSSGLGRVHEEAALFEGG